MSKTLSNVLTVFKVARIVAKVGFILCIVGGAGCLLGVASLVMLSSIQLGDVQLVLFEATGGMDPASVIPSCALGALARAGEGAIAFFAERYCKNVLKAGTPFTHAGAKECFRLGLISILASFAVMALAGIVTAIMALFSVSVAKADFNMTISLVAGLFFLFLSMIFKHGAELGEAATSTETVEKTLE